MVSETRSQAFFRCLDHVVPPETRQKALDFFVKFTHERPYLATYIYLNLLFALLPLLGLVVFVVFLLSVLLFWVAVALCITASILLLTATVATMAWIWAVCVVLSGRWVLNLATRRAPEAERSRTSKENESGSTISAKKHIEAPQEVKKENISSEQKQSNDEKNEKTFDDDYLDFVDGPGKDQEEKDDNASQNSPGGFVAVKTPGGAQGDGGMEPESEAKKMRRDIARSLQ